VANTKSAKKTVRTHARNQERNTSIRTAVKGLLKKAVVGIQENSANKVELVRDASQSIDRAVSKGVFHKNKAARKKSRLAKKLNKAAAAVKA
jgi:small subunit ribosomal protein S20